MLNIVKLIDRIASTDKKNLSAGESGTGEEVVAKVIQQNNCTASVPFVAVNGAALPEQLVEIEWFGHQKGAFTGATAEKPCLFEVADGGTLFDIVYRRTWRNAACTAAKAPACAQRWIDAANRFPQRTTSEGMDHRSDKS